MVSLPSIRQMFPEYLDSVPSRCNCGDHYGHPSAESCGRSASYHGSQYYTSPHCRESPYASSSYERYKHQGGSMKDSRTVPSTLSNRDARTQPPHGTSYSFDVSSSGSFISESINPNTKYYPPNHAQARSPPFRPSHSPSHSPRLPHHRRNSYSCRLSPYMPHATSPSSASEESVDSGMMSDDDSLSVDGVSQGKRHVCRVCSKRFNRPSSLRIHVNTHTGATPYQCPWPECGRLFNVNSNMRRHYRNHTASSPSSATSPHRGRHDGQ